MIKRIDILNEEYEVYTLENGLTVYLMTKPDYKQTLATLSTRYGSFNNEFIPINEDKYTKIPLGVAHFLEHKLFEQPDESDVTIEFSKLGADCNAFTTYNQTSYLFSATKKVPECLNLLLDFVYTPHFTKESVEKELPIIDQELRMYLDDERSMLANLIFEAMYEKNALRYDIGGTVDTIKDIDENILKFTYDTFYHPSNMVLTVVGGFNLLEIKQVINNFFNKKKFDKYQDPQTKFYLENNIVYKKSKRIYKDITTPLISVGVKIYPEALPQIDTIKKSIYLDILLDILYGESSDNYNRWNKRGLIDYNFTYNSSFEKYYANIVLSASTQNPTNLINTFKRSLLNIKNLKITKETFEHYRKLQLSTVIRKFNYVEPLSYLLSDFAVAGDDLLDSIKEVYKLDYEEFLQITSLISKESICSVKILPLSMKKPSQNND